MGKQAEMFDIPDSLSPYQAFVKKHGIRTHYAPHMGKGEEWCAYIGDLMEFIEETEIMPAATQKDAVFELASYYKLEGWDKLNWG